MPYKECDECGNEVYYSAPEPKKIIEPDYRYYKLIEKAYDRLMELYQLQTKELGRAESERDPVQINLIQGQINILRYVVDGAK